MSQHPHPSRLFLVLRNSAVSLWSKVTTLVLSKALVFFVKGALNKLLLLVIDL